MNQLKVISLNGQLVTDSRDVAKMIGKRHADLLRDIEGYRQILENATLRSQDFFLESSYKSEGNNKTYPCYLLTRKGCDMVANKMTGEKGVLFTAAYVTKFEEMEKQLYQPPKTQLEILQGTINQLVEQEQRLSAIESRTEAIEQKQNKITEVLSLNPTEWRKKTSNLLNKIAQQRGGYEAFKDVRAEAYQLLEERAKCLLSKRLTNKKQKAALEGLAKSKIDKLNKMDVIADDARLTEIFLAVVKEMAVRYEVDAS